MYRWLKRVHQLGIIRLERVELPTRFLLDPRFNEALPISATGFLVVSPPSEFFYTWFEMFRSREGARLNKQIERRRWGVLGKKRNRIAEHLAEIIAVDVRSTLLPGKRFLIKRSCYVDVKRGRIVNNTFDITSNNRTMLLGRRCFNVSCAWCAEQNFLPRSRCLEIFWDFHRTQT